MALPATQFTRPQRQPGIIEQAFIGFGSSLLRKKFITDPAERAAEEFSRETATTLADRRALESKKDIFARIGEIKLRGAEQRETDVQRLAGTEEARIGATPTIEESMAFIEPLVQQLGIDFDLEEEGIQAPTFEEGADPQRAVDTLAELRRTEAAEDRDTAAAAVQERNRLARQESRIQHLRLNALPREDLEPALIRDENGVVRFLTEDEINIRTTQQAADRAIEIDFETKFFTRLQGKARDVEGRLVKVPAYSATAETDWLGRLRGLTPGSEYTGVFNGLVGVLEQAGLAGGFGRGEDPWFINDQGVRVETKGDADLLARMPGEAASRVRGALWARMFFPDPSKLHAALKRHGIVDALAEETYRAIKGLPPKTGAAVRQTAGDITRPPATKASEFLTAGARRVAAGNDEAVDAINFYIGNFESGIPGLSPDSAYANVDALIDQSDEDFRASLVSEGVLGTAQEARGTGPGGFSAAIPEPELPDRAKLKSTIYSVIGAAIQDVAERRRTRGTPTPKELGAKVFDQGR